MVLLIATGIENRHTPNRVPRRIGWQVKMILKFYKKSMKMVIAILHNDVEIVM